MASNQSSNSSLSTSRLRPVGMPLRDIANIPHARAGNTPVASSPRLVNVPPRDDALLNSSEAGAQSQAAHDRLARERQEARIALRAVLHQMEDVLTCSPLDLAAVEMVLGRLKSLHKTGQVWRLGRSDADFLKVVSALVRLIKRLSSELDTQALSLASASMPTLRSIVNVMSLVLASDSSDNIVSRSQLKGLRAPLQSLHKAVLDRVFAMGLPHSLQANGDLLDLMTWASHGLKQRVLPCTDKLVTKLYEEGLSIICNWPAASGEKTGPSGEIDRLDTRQLGKVMVQANAAVTQRVLDVDPASGAHNRAMLARLVLRLCGGKALDQCFAWPDAPQDAPYKPFTMIPVLPRVPSVANICNTIKDFLDLGLLDLRDDALQDIVNKLCRQMLALEPKFLFERGGQGVGNCCNFLRTIFEVQQRPGAASLKDATAWTQACLTMLQLVAARCGQSAPPALSRQAVTNLFSFGKSMARTGAFEAGLLARLAQAVTAALPDNLDDITQVQHLAGLLAGLQHFAQCALLPARTAHGLMDALLGNIASLSLQDWTARACSLCLRAALYRYEFSQARQEQAAAQLARGVMHAFLALGRKAEEDRLACLQALLALIGHDQALLQAWQQSLQRLTGLKRAVSLEDARHAMDELSAKEGRAQPIARLEILPQTSAAAEAVALSEVGELPPRLPDIPGLTRLIAPESPGATTRTTTNTSALTTTTAVRHAPLPQEPQWRDVVKGSKPVTLAAEPSPECADEREDDSEGKPDPGESTSNAGVQSKTPRLKRNRKKARAAARQRAQAQKQADNEALDGLDRSAAEFLELARREAGQDGAGTRRRMEELAKLYPRLFMLRESATGHSAVYYAIVTGKASVSSWLASQKPVRVTESLEQLEQALALGPQTAPAVRKSLTALLLRWPLWEVSGPNREAALRMARACGLEHVVQTGMAGRIIPEFLREPLGAQASDALSAVFPPPTADPAT